MFDRLSLQLDDEDDAQNDERDQKEVLLRRDDLLQKNQLLTVDETKVMGSSPGANPMKTFTRFLRSYLKIFNKLGRFNNSFLKLVILKTTQLI